MPKINVVNSDNVIECKPQKAFFKLTNTGGLKGDKGDKGDDATISVGTTTTGEPGTNASVTNSGTSSAAVLDFTIPRGADGADGAAATVAVGTTTTLDAGSSATVTNSGTSSAAILDFGIPKGADGQDGQDGAAATITVGSTTTGEPGTNASVTNSGTTSAAVLNFTIPRGATGATGQDGADGFSPSATVTSSNNDATISITDKDGETTATVKGFGFEEVSTLPASGSSEKLYLTPHTYPTNTATGSSINLNDSAAAPLKSVQNDGETIQTGKNIFDKNNVHAINAYVASQAINSATDTTIFVVCKPSTTYTITKTASTPQTANRFRVATTSVVPAVGVAVSDFINPGDGTADTSVTITTGSSAQYLVVTLQTSAATSSLSSIYSTLQIEEGSSSTPYEPYIGGVPNPNYPVPIKTVTGENVVKICGKNIYDTASVTVSGANNQNIRFTTLLQPSTQYTFNVTDSRPYAAVYLYNSDGAMTRSIGNAQSSHTLTFTTSSAEVSGKFDFYASPNVDISTYDFTGVQLELGNQATAYQAYTGQSYEVNLGKNLFDKTNVTSLDGYPSATTITSNNYHKTIYIKCEPNTTYTVQKINKGNNKRFALATTATLPVIGGSTLQFDQDNDADSITITTNSSARYLLVWCYVTNDTGVTWDEIISSLQIEKGSQASSYAAYFTPIELCKIGDYQDYIYKSGEKWYLHKEINRGAKDVEVAAIASDNTASPTSASAEGTFQIGGWAWGADYANTIANARMSSNIGVYKLDTSLAANTQARAMTNGTFCQRYGTNDRVYFRNTTYIGKTGNEIRAMLLSSGGGADFVWVMTTPTDTEITNSALVAQLNALAAGTTYEGITNIAFTCAQGNDNGELEIEYYTQYDAMRLYDKFIWINKWEAL